jgi:mRNA interferase MazF
MERIPVGSVVLVFFPYPDSTGGKRRPALVIAEANAEEYFLLEITSQPKQFPSGLFITGEDFESGGLRLPSQVRCDRLFTAHESVINPKAGKLKSDKFQTILAKTLSLFPKVS